MLHTIKGLRQVRGARGFSVSSRALLQLKNVTKTGLEIELEPGSTPVHFSNFFLRDAATSTNAIDPSTSQRYFSSGELAKDVHPKKIHVGKKEGQAGSDTVYSTKDTKICQHETDIDGLKIEWSDGFQEYYTAHFLKQYQSPEASRKRRHLAQPINLWERKEITSALDKNEIQTTWKEYQTTEGMHKIVKALHDYGLAFVTELPDQNTKVVDAEDKDVGTVTAEPILVEEVGKKIGYIKETFYGRSWDTRSVPNPKNVAYTSQYLPLHMDLLYYESPPGIQLLHVIKNQAIGGESIFTDSFASAKYVWEKNPAAYRALCEIPLTFHYINDGQHYHNTVPMIVEHQQTDKSKWTNPKAINYAPPFQGPFDAVELVEGGKKCELFREGLRLFEEHLTSAENELRTKMEENSCVLFLNRRVLHSRTEFDAQSGVRWLKGTYLDIDAFYSKLRVLSNDS